jgi:Ca2+-dependent lipid-binding protein
MDHCYHQIIFEISKMLKVFLNSGSNLLSGDLNGLSDPYCIFTLGNHQKKSKHILKTLNPTWNETFMFKVENPKDEILKIKVIDWDFMKKGDFLGEVEIKLSDLTKEIEGDYKLTTKGSINLKLVPVGFESQQKIHDKIEDLKSTGRLEVTLNHAKNLIAKGKKHLKK